MADRNGQAGYKSETVKGCVRILNRIFMIYSGVLEYYMRSIRSPQVVAEDNAETLRLDQNQRTTFEHTESRGMIC